MIASLKKLLKHSTIYGFGSVLNRLIGFILLPLYTRYLTTVDYGISSLLLTTNSVAVIIAQWGLGSALFREVILHDSDEDEVESTALVFLLVESLLVFGVLLLLSNRIAVLIFGDVSQALLLRLTFLTGFLQIIKTVFMARLRIREQSSFYSIISISSFVVGTGFNVYFVAILQLGVAGLVLATLATTGLFSLVYLVIMIRGLKFSFSLPSLQRMLRFGVPLVPGGLASMVMTSADRYFLQHYSTTAEVGLYSLGYKIGLVMNLIVQAVQLAWPAEKFEIMKEPDAERRFSKLLTYYLTGLGFISLGFSVLAREMLVVMTTPDFYAASTVIPLILLSYLFYGVRFMTNVGLTRENKMEYGSMVIFGTAIISLGLNYWLIPRYGMLGAAWTTFITYGVLSISSTLINLHFWHIPYEYGRIVKLAVVWGMIYFASLHVEVPNIILSIAFKILLIASFPVLLYIFRFFTQEELLKLKQILISRTKRINHLWKSE